MIVCTTTMRSILAGHWDNQFNLSHIMKICDDHII